MNPCDTCGEVVETLFQCANCLSSVCINCLPSLERFICFYCHTSEQQELLEQKEQKEQTKKAISQMCYTCENIYEVNLFNCANCGVDVCINCIPVVENELCFYCNDEIEQNTLAETLRKIHEEENTKKCSCCNGKMEFIRNCDLCNDEICSICYNRYFRKLNQHVCIKHVGRCEICNRKSRVLRTCTNCTECTVSACEACIIALPNGQFMCKSHATKTRCQHYNLKILCQVKNCNKSACFDVLSSTPAYLRPYSLCDFHSYGKCKLCRYRYPMLVEYFIYGYSYRICEPCRYELHKKLITYYLCLRQKMPKELRNLILQKILFFIFLVFCF